MKIIQRLKKWLNKEHGALIIESAFVYPIMFFVLMFLLYMGNMYYLKAKINSVVSQEAITYAARFADPNQEQFDKTIPTSNQGDTQVTKELYRYLDVFNISDYGTASDVQKSELIKEIEDTGFYAGMTPANITVETHKVHNYVVYQTYEVTVNYQLKFPIRFIFSKDVVLLNMTAHEETPVIDTSEFIRNVDMAVDYVERTETGQSILTTLDNTYARIEKFIDGEKKPDPSEAVAGGVSGDENSDQANDVANNINPETIDEDAVGRGEHYTTNEKGQKVLKPNITYTINGYTYTTDSQGRIASVTGTITQEKMKNPGKRNYYAQRVAGREDRICTSNGNKGDNQPADDGGHLIGSQFGGSGDLDNLVAMSSKTNRAGGKWYSMEKKWAEAAQKVKMLR